VEADLIPPESVVRVGHLADEDLTLSVLDI